MEELQIYVVLILVIASHTGDRYLSAQGRLMHMGIHQHNRVQGEMLPVEGKLIRDT